MPVERIQPSGLSQPTMNAGQPSYAHVVKAGNTVYISGQVARNGQGEIVGIGDIEAQVTQVFENLKTAMAAVNGDLRNLVKVVIYLTDPRFRDAIRLNAMCRSKFCSAASATPICTTPVTSGTT